MRDANKTLGFPGDKVACFGILIGVERSKLIWIGVFIGGIVGGYVPALWGSGVFSVSSIIFSGIGSFIGIWLGFKLGE
jgi:hypothetical protein